jgi:hypothetical protein
MGGCRAHLDRRRADLRYQRKEARIIRRAVFACVLAAAVGASIMIARRTMTLLDARAWSLWEDTYCALLVTGNGKPTFAKRWASAATRAVLGTQTADACTAPWRMSRHGANFGTCSYVANFETSFISCSHTFLTTHRAT